MTMHRTHRSRSARGRLSAAAAEAWIPRTCFKHGPPGRVGVELELLVHDRSHPGRPTDGPAFDPMRRAAGEVPLASRVTLEPGGQVELSSAPHDHVTAALAEALADLTRLRGVAAGHGADLVGLALDPRVVHRRVLAEPRYAAMEAYLDRWGPAGRVMMRRTASVQVNVEASAGAAGDAQRRWTLLHAVGPPLVAAFANSPGPRDTPWAGWPCGRMGVWLALDPQRTGQAPQRPGEPVEQAWARWALDAPLLLVRRPAGPWTPPAASFRDWLEGGQDVVPDRPPPDLDDLAYHLTTLFPPVRPRGHLEVRYVDAQPGDWWAVPVAVLWALAADPSAGERATTACAGQWGRWSDAARCGLRDDGLAAAALGVLDAAADTLAAAPATAGCARLVRAYRDHWTARRRCPADDRLDGVPTPPADLERALVPAPQQGAGSPLEPAPDRKDLPC